VVVTATEADTKRVIGISTGMPLAHEAPELQAPFHQQGVDITRIFYFGESVLEPAYRGQGIGKRFFEARQAHVDHLGGYDTTCFCAVIRPETHPRRPADYRPLDPFWRSLGYTPHPDRVAQLAWRDLDEPEETPKPMQFWLRPISQPQPQKER
jgi:GNAT superfamily N-acetyltransferase